MLRGLYDDFLEQLRETIPVEQNFPLKLKLKHELAQLKVVLLSHTAINSLHA